MRANTERGRAISKAFNFIIFAFFDPKERNILEYPT